MSRSYTHTRLQNFEDDSDEDFQTKAAVRKVAARRQFTQQPRAPAKSASYHSSDDSQDENDVRKMKENASNRPTEDYDASKYAIRMSTGRRGAPNAEPGSPGGRNFVPRDISQKSRRQHSSHEDKSTLKEVEEKSKPEPWTATPKTFLAEPSSEPYPSKIPIVANGKRKQQPQSKPPTRPIESKPQVPERNDSEDDDDDKSVESSNTIEEYDAPRSISVERTLHDREPCMFDGFSQVNPMKIQKSLRIPGQPAPQRNIALKLEQSDEFDTDVIKDGEFYTDFVRRSQAIKSNSPSQPVKSGRYTDEDTEPQRVKSTNWLSNDSLKNHSSPLGSKASWSSVLPPPTNIPGGLQTSPSNRYSFVMIAHARGIRTEHVQCTVVRDRRASLNGKLHPTYELILDETRKPIMMAQKMNMNRTSNYHLFDLTRAQLGTKLSKKSGNYIGKLRAKNTNRTEYVLLNQNSEREEIAGVKFDRVSLMDQLKEGNQPRKMKIMVPPLDTSGVPVPNRTNDSDAGSLAEKLKVYEGTALGRGSKDLYVFESKDPVFENGNFRLNFHGRVNKPSVKNFQMVSREDIDDVICQFGKVDEDIFHLDFKAPLNACQAFAFALCQFNL